MYVDYTVSSYNVCATFILINLMEWYVMPDSKIQKIESYDHIQTPGGAGSHCIINSYVAMH